MKRLVPVIVALSAAAVGWAGGGTGPAARAEVSTAGLWGRAIEVPGLGALNTAGDAQVTSLSCASAGTCAAGGYYSARDKQGFNDGGGFVVNERNGRWGKAREVPGLAALNKTGVSYVNSVSCAPAGGCVAGGDYGDRFGNSQGFVATERDGVWGKAIAVPGLGALNRGPDDGYGAQVSSVSCASPGNCVASGYYQDRNDNQQGFVADERHGRWGKAIEVPGLGALNTGGHVYVNAVSCVSAGNCAAGGQYDGPGSGGFVATERDGVWNKATQITGLAAGTVNSVSCSRAGSCAAGGIYVLRRPLGRTLGFVVVERGGRWGNAIEVPGLAALSKNPSSGAVNSVSCASPGNCVAGGFYADGGFVAVERNGRWGKAIPVPGLAALAKGRGVDGVVSVSCASAGNCAVGGTYADGAGLLRPFVAAERNGRWGKAIPVPGLATLNKGSSQPFSIASYDPVVSCAAAGTCAVGGQYTDASKHAQGFVTQTR